MSTEPCNCTPALLYVEASCVALQAAAFRASKYDSPKAQICCVSSCVGMHAAGTYHGSCCRQPAQGQLGSNSTAAEGCASSSTDICSLAGRHSLLSQCAGCKSLSQRCTFLCLCICISAMHFCCKCFWLLPQSICCHHCPIGTTHSNTTHGQQFPCHTAADAHTTRAAYCNQPQHVKVTESQTEGMQTNMQVLQASTNHTAIVVCCKQASTSGLSFDQVSQSATQLTCKSRAELEAAFQHHLAQFHEPSGYGMLLFLFSLLLSHGLRCGPLLMCPSRASDICPNHSQQSCKTCMMCFVFKAQPMGSAKISNTCLDCFCC